MFSSVLHPFQVWPGVLICKSSPFSPWLSSQIKKQTHTRDCSKPLQSIITLHFNKLQPHLFMYSFDLRTGLCPQRQQNLGSAGLILWSIVWVQSHIVVHCWQKYEERCFGNLKGNSHIDGKCAALLKVCCHCWFASQKVKALPQMIMFARFCSCSDGQLN